MNVQIYGRAKCFDTRAAERFFKERKIKYQYIDIDRYSMKEREFLAVSKSIGGVDGAVNENAKAYGDLNFDKLRTPEVKLQTLLANPALFKTPIVRNGNRGTVGNNPAVWQQWIADDKK